MSLKIVLKKKHLKILLVLALCLGVFIAGDQTGFNRAIAGYIGDLTETWIPPPYSPYTYTIGQYNSTHYFMQNNTGYGLSAYKGYEYMSSNASKVFNFALRNASNAGGGSVYVKSGDYNFTANIQMQNNTRLIGENPYSTILINGRPQATGKVGGLIENFNHNESVKQPSTSWNKDYNITVEGFGMEGYMGTRAGFAIAMTHVDNVAIRDMVIRNFASDSINFNGLSYAQGGRGQGNGTTVGLTIDDVNIWKSGIDGIALNAVYNFTISRYRVTKFSQVGSGTNNGWGITLAGACEYGKVSNFVIGYSTEISSGGMGSGGLHVINGKWITFSDGTIMNVNGTGTFVESAGSGNPQWIEFVSVQIINSTRENWYFKNGYDITVMGGVGLNAGYSVSATRQRDNMYFYNTERSRVIGTELRDNQSPHTTWNGIYEDSASASNIFADILIYGCANATGIYLKGSGTLNSTIITSP